MTSASHVRSPSEPAALEVYAADNLRFIRETMERASAFTAVPGEGGIAIGLTALAVGYFAQPYPLRTQFWIWLLEGVLAVVLGGIALYRKSRRIGFPLAARAGRRALLSFVTPLAAAAVLALALYRAGAVSLFPGLALLLYGVAVVAAGSFSVRIVPVMGLCFLCLGAIAVFTPSPWGNIWMTAGFGALHVVFGFIIARKHGG